MTDYKEVESAVRQLTMDVEILYKELKDIRKILENQKSRGPINVNSAPERIVFKD